MRKLLLFIVCLPFIACGQAEKTKDSKPENNPEWNTFKTSNFTIQYPPDWKLNQSGQMGTTFVLYAPMDSPQDKFSENVNLLIQDLSGLAVNLNKFVEISEKQLFVLMTNASLLESTRIKSGSDEYHKIVYTADQGDFKLKFEQYFWMKNEQAIILTYTCEQSNAAEYKALADAMMHSFTLLE